MIISHNYKFIFIKNYKTAGSSIESHLYKILSKSDIIAGTIDYKGINNRSQIDWSTLSKFQNQIGKNHFNKIKNNNFTFWPHMPAWLVSEILMNKTFSPDNSQSINYKNIFDRYFKFAVIRNPFSLIVSHYKWINSNQNPRKKEIAFKDIILEIEQNRTIPNKLDNLKRIMNINYNQLIIDQVVKFENLDEELILIQKKLNLPLDSLKIFLKKSNDFNDYRSYYDNHSKNIILKKFRTIFEMFNYDF